MQARNNRISSNYAFIKTPENMTLTRLRKRQSFSEKLNELTRLYLTSRATRSLASLVWCSATMAAALLEIGPDSNEPTCQNVRLAIIGAASYMVISGVCLVTHLLGQRMPTVSIVMFSLVGGIMHIMAGAGPLHWRFDFCCAAILSTISGLILLMDACVTCVSDAIQSFSWESRMNARDKFNLRRKLRGTSSTDVIKLIKKNSQEQLNVDTD